MAKILAGIDFGGTNLKIGCFDENLNLLVKDSVPAQINAGPTAVVEKIGELTARLVNLCGHKTSDIIAAGIGTPGVVDVENGVVLATSNIKFTNIPLRQMVRDKLNVPVILENDANVTCWAERVAGAGKGATEMALITLGTGIGGGIITNGELVRGFAGNGGEIGHIIIKQDGRLCGCGQKGCIEAYGSASATAGRATEAIAAGGKSSLQKILEKSGHITCKDVYEHSAAGDELARQITDETAKSLATLCINLLHITGPRRIIFYGGMIEAGELLLLEPMRKFFDEHIWKIRKESIELCFAALGAEAGIIGAAALASHELKKGKII